MPPWAATIGLFLVAVGVAVSGWALIEQNRQLRAALASRNPERPAIDGYAIGDGLGDAGDALVAVDKDQPITVATMLGEEGGILAFLTVTCQFCHETLPVWADVARDLEALDIRFVGLSFNSAEATVEYRTRNDISWPIWHIHSAQDFSRFRVATRALAAGVPPQPRPNMVVVLIDDMRWDDYGAGGHPFVETPSIDRVAREGARFRNAFATMTTGHEVAR